MKVYYLNMKKTQKTKIRYLIFYYINYLPD